MDRQPLAALVIVGVLIATAVLAAPLKVEVRNARGQSVGTATVSESTMILGGQAFDSVEIKLDLKGLPPGEHAINLHEHAKCEAPGFASSGDHIKGTDYSGKPGEVHELLHHGKKNQADPGHYHFGDLGNFTVQANGKAKVTIDRVIGLGHIQFGALGANGAPSITLPHSQGSIVLRNGGSSLVIDARRDDEESDPEGGSGDHIACGVIR